jgi:hypothetical protein
MRPLILNRLRTLCTPTAMRIAGVVLVGTAILKFVTVRSLPALLVSRDPVFAIISEERLLELAALLELTVATIIFVKPLSWSAAACLFLIAQCFACYRVGLWLVGYKGGCLCLGKAMTFTSLFANVGGEQISLVLLCYIFGAALLALWRQAGVARG